LSVNNNYSVAKKTNIRSYEHINQIFGEIQTEFKKTGKGLHIKELAKKIKVDRTTVGRLCNILEQRQWIYRENQQSPYCLTETGKKQPHLHRRMYGFKQLKRVWEVKPNLFSTKGENEYLNGFLPVKMNHLSQVSRQGIHVDIGSSSFQVERTFKSEELELFEFGNKIGAIITYFLIQALYPLEQAEKKENDLPSSPIEVDEDLIKFLDTVIKPLEILNEFCKLSIVKRGQKRYQIPKERLENMKNKIYELNKKKEAGLTEQENAKLVQTELVYKNLTELNREIVRVNSSVGNSNYKMDPINADRLKNIFKTVYPLVFQILEDYEKKQASNYYSSLEWFHRFKEERFRTEKKMKKGKKKPKKSICVIMPSILPASIFQ